jgi:hypothetical protein
MPARLKSDNQRTKTTSRVRVRAMWQTRNGGRDLQIRVHPRKSAVSGFRFFLTVFPALHPCLSVLLSVFISGKVPAAGCVT